MNYQGFLSPPNQTAVSAWEDPSFLDYIPWSPFDSLNALKHHIKIVLNNARKVLRYFVRFSPFSIAICLSYLLLLLQRPRKILTQCEVLYPFVGLLLFSAGYSLILVCERYLWVTCFLLLLMGGYTVDKLFQSNFFTKIRKTTLYIVFAASFAYTPIVSGLVHVNSGRSDYLLSQTFKNHIRPGDRIASNTEWHRTMYLAYHLGARYYGVAWANISKHDLEDELRKFNIHHYLVWGETVKNKLSLSEYKQVDIDGTIEPKLYSLATMD